MDPFVLITAILGLPLAFGVWYASIELRNVTAKRIRAAILVLLASVLIPLCAWLAYSVSLAQECAEWFILSFC